MSAFSIQLIPSVLGQEACHGSNQTDSDENKNSVELKKPHVRFEELDCLLAELGIEVLDNINSTAFLKFIERVFEIDDQEFVDRLYIELQREFGAFTPYELFAIFDTNNDGVIDEADERLFLVNTRHC